MNKEFSLTSREDLAWFSRDCYVDHDQEDPVALNGLGYKIFDTINTPIGFQATAYRRISDDKITIAYRGTEAIKAKFWDQPVKDLGADYEMVRNQTNKQLPDADAFTQRVLEKVKKRHPDWNLNEHVDVTGHSLGGTLAEIMAARYGLGGAAFNAYGAVDLSYGVPEGQPENAPAFVGYVRATDVVSAASPHYGSVRVLATEQDIENLRAGRYLDAPDPAHPANPLLGASLAAHFVNNFAPDPGQDESVMSAANEARYRQHQIAIDHYRRDVMLARVNLHDVWQHSQDPTHAAQLEARVADALSVASYHMVVERAASLAGVTAGQRALHGLAGGTHLGAQTMQNLSDSVARRTQSVGESVQHFADSAAQSALTLHDNMLRGVDTASPHMNAVPPSFLVDGGAGLDIQAPSLIAAGSEKVLADATQSVGRTIHGVTAQVSQATGAIGETVHTVLDEVSRHAHAAEARIEHAVQAAASVQAHDRAHEALTDAMHAVERTYDNVRGTVIQTIDTLSHGITPTSSPFEPGAVRTLQQQLKTLGMTDHRGQPLPVTGNYDDLTRHAVTMFQKEQGVPETGVPDTATRALIDARASIVERRQVEGEHTPTSYTMSSRKAVHDANDVASLQRSTQPAMAEPGLDDPRHMLNPQHALYDELKTRFPEASEKRLLQFTAACHIAGITDRNLDAVRFDREGGFVHFGACNDLVAKVATVDVKQSSPSQEQSIRQIYQYDQNQVQLRTQIQAQIAAQNQAQQGPVLGGR